ncbi:autotransporter domain-containing protein [Erwinia sp. AnSW2-5]|uniref:autotransporter family protein n=1 Tax=Erwinia sp. AnSW2-5 TaxID=3367692 RepID=UPI00385D461D
MKFKKNAYKIQLSPSWRLSTLSLSLIGALSSLQATATTISTALTSPYVYSSGTGNLDITSTGSVIPGASNNALLILSGTLGTVSNNGSIISGNLNGLVNGTTIGTLNNMGLIRGGYAAIQNAGSITTLNNSGTIISASSFGIINAGTIGTITNSGLIRGDIALILESGSTTGVLKNSGTIVGGIVNNSSQDLTIQGGNGTIFGTLTGGTGNNIISSASIGTIASQSSNVNFTSGNLLLNDNIDTGSNTVNNTGATLQVNNALSITGNYAQAADASLLIGVASGATTLGGIDSDLGYGRLLVSGTASIASGSSIGLKSLGYAFAGGQRYVVISAGTGIYNESSLKYSATGYNGSITGAAVADGANTDLVLTLSGNSTPGTNNPTPGNSNNTSHATTTNAVSSLRGLQNYSGISDAALLNLYNASLAISSTAEANKSGEQLSPHQNASAGMATSSATFDMINVIGNRLSNIDAVRIARANQGESGLSAGDDALQQSGWGQIFGGQARQDMTDDISGYRANYGGAVMGYDHAITEDWRLGGAFSYTYTSVDGRDNVQGSNSDVKSYGLTAYASYAAPTWYSNLYAAVLEQNYKTQRQVSFTGYDGVANGNFDGQQYALKAEFGYPIALTSNVTLTPIANATYSYLYQEGYTESGGNGAALKVDSAHSDSIKSGLGAKLETTLSSRLGDVVPYVQVLWNHQYNNNSMDITSAYAASTAETSFVSQGSSPTRDSADVMVGATLLSSRNTSMTAYYDLGTASNYTNQSVSLRFKQLF